MTSPYSIVLLFLFVGLEVWAQGSTPTSAIPPGHPAISKNENSNPEEQALLDRLDASADAAKGEKTFEVANALGKLYYDHRRYLRSAEFFKQALEKRQVLETRLMLAKAYFLAGNSLGSIEEFETVLKKNPGNQEALYGHATLLFDVQGDNPIALKQARKEFAAFLRGSQDPAKRSQAKMFLNLIEQAIASGGARKMSEARASRELGKADLMITQGSPPPLSPQVVEAVKNTERTPEFERGMATLTEASESALTHGDAQVALDGYKRIVPFQPENARARAGMAWALVMLNKQPMADRIWQVAANSAPAALEKLGDTLYAKGDAKGARALWLKLTESAPEYASKSFLQAKLK